MLALLFLRDKSYIVRCWFEANSMLRPIHHTACLNIGDHKMGHKINKIQKYQPIRAYAICIFIICLKISRLFGVECRFTAEKNLQNIVNKYISPAWRGGLFGHMRTKNEMWNRFLSAKSWVNGNSCKTSNKFTHNYQSHEINVLKSTKVIYD